MYRAGMDLLPVLKPGKIILAYNASAILPSLLAELALCGPVTVLDGGNRFPAYRIAQELRKRNLDIHAAAERLYLRRAFTAYQIVHLLESTPATTHPYIILDLFTTLQDDQVHPREADRLLTQCFIHLERLSLASPIVLCSHSIITEDKAFLLQRLTERIDETFFFAEPTVAQTFQPALLQMDT